MPGKKKHHKSHGGGGAQSHPTSASPSQKEAPETESASKIVEVPGTPAVVEKKVVCLPSSKDSPVLEAVRLLLDVIKTYNGTTVNGLIDVLKTAKITHTAAICSRILTKSKLAVNSACDQFIRYATLTLSSIESGDISNCREQMLMEGVKYMRRCERSIEKISRWAVTLIFDGAKILVHSDSMVVLEALRSVPKNIYFSVYIALDDDRVANFFEGHYNIDVKIIRDAEVGTLMENMDLAMVGAEAVLKNGGIINKVGTLSLAICAREMNKPMYVLAESFKFSLMYPMSQSDLQKEIREDAATRRIRVDYTPPKYITFLVTDRGLLTPTAVCDELIELYT